MIRHLAELGVLLLLAAVGVGLVAAFIIGLLGIWAKVADEPDAIHEEYRRVEEAGAFLSESALHERRWLESANAQIIASPRPYNWATREPMIWAGGGK